MVSDAQPVVAARPREMNAWRMWWWRPQSLWIRRALFQVHLWMGIGIGLYVLLISVSGSAVVYRRELMRKYAPNIAVAVRPGGELSLPELKQKATAAYPGYDVVEAYESRRPDRAATVTFRQNTRNQRPSRMERLFDPYTGADIGDTETPIQRDVQWMVDLHDNLLAGQTGRWWNGVGAILVTILALSGMFLWWPGVKNWRRSTTIQWRARFPRFNWDTHSAVGFWLSLMILMWGVSGIYFAFPEPFNAFFGDTTLGWLARLHFGRMGRVTEILWTILGLAPAALFITGLLMWWNRKLRKIRLSWND